MTDDAKPKVEAPEPEPKKNPEPDTTPPPPETNDGDVTTQPAISTKEAAATDVELSPVGDVVTTIPAEVELVTTEETDGQIEVRSVSDREIGALIAPFDRVTNTQIGLETFKRGAFAHVNPKNVVLKMGHEGPPVGRGISIEERSDGAYMAFRVSKTLAGDEALTLAIDGVTKFVSIEYDPRSSEGVVAYQGRQRVTELTKVGLKGVATTYKPVYDQAEVLYVREQEGVVPVTEATEAPVTGAVATDDKITETITAGFRKLEERELARQVVQDKFAERFEKLEEQQRSNITVPATAPVVKPGPSKGEWIQTVVKLMTGERIAESQMRELAEVITSDNAGVVPTAFLTELIGVIDSSRPFLSTTRRLDTPTSGMTISVPVINQRPTVGIQVAEKDEVSSQKTLIGTTTFDAVTIAGAGDLSIQIIKRSSPSFLNLWVELLAEAYAIESEDVAIQALFNAIGGVGAGTALNPAALNLGAAFVTSFDAIRRPPDTIWLSTQAVGEFIDAKATTTNQPLYPGLRASATAAGGIEGVISGLRPVHVPTLDAHGAYAIVGPSSGFAWAEDGTYTLQVDVPAKAGRDVALVGILWPMPWYPAAFTPYNVAS